MKKTILTIAAAAFLLGFASCSKENEQPGPNGPVAAEGKETFMNLSITFPTEPGTKATGDPNATNKEAQINRVDVFIYTGMGLFSSHKTLTLSDFSTNSPDGTADRYNAITKIPTTTGTKLVFVGINLPQRIVDACKSKAASEIASTVQTMSHDDLVGDLHDDFVMFSKKGYTSVFVEDQNAASNKIVAECERFVAKVTVETSPTVDLTSLPGTLNNLVFTIDNYNTKFFLLQGAADEYRDPNWTLSSYVSTDFLRSSSINHEYWAQVLRTATLSDPANPTLSDWKATYAPENTSFGKRKKEITRVNVRGEFIPAKITQYKSGSTTEFEVVDNSVNTAQTFWAITVSALEGTFFFYDLTTAYAFATAYGSGTQLPTTMYTNGECYWFIFLNKNPNNLINRWDVLRNDYYRCVITKISSLGRATPDLGKGEEDDTPDVDTSISVDVKIMFWHTPIKSEYILD